MHAVSILQTVGYSDIKEYRPFLHMKQMLINKLSFGMKEFGTSTRTYSN